MEGTKAIINRIIEDANKKAKVILAEATNDANEKISEANAWADEYKNAQTKAINKEAEDIVTRRMTVAELDVRKISIGKKQELVSKVFDSVLEKLINCDKKTYLSLVEKLLNENAEEEDGVVLSNDGVLSETDVIKLDVFNKKKLSVIKERGDFKGGVMLVGKVCDKNLSFEGLISEKKDYYVSQIAETLFQ